ncbi:MAG: hypothetical protein AAF602_12720, partial [Myxococcota bacterium]
MLVAFVLSSLTHAGRPAPFPNRDVSPRPSFASASAVTSTNCRGLRTWQAVSTAGLALTGAGSLAVAGSGA